MYFCDTKTRQPIISRNQLWAQNWLARSSPTRFIQELVKNCLCNLLLRNQRCCRHEADSDSNRSELFSKATDFFLLQTNFSVTNRLRKRLAWFYKPLETKPGPQLWLRRF